LFVPLEWRRTDRRAASWQSALLQLPQRRAVGGGRRDERRDEIAKSDRPRRLDAVLDDPPASWSFSITLLLSVTPTSTATTSTMADISEEQAELTAMFGATKKKKKTTTKKTADATAAEGDAAATTAEGATDATVASSSAAKAEEKKADAPFRMYDYEFLLNRVMTLVQQNNPELVEKSRTKMPPPQVQRCTLRLYRLGSWADGCR
jgi:hypothetical protein